MCSLFNTEIVCVSNSVVDIVKNKLRVVYKTISQLLNFRRDEICIAWTPCRHESKSTLSLRRGMGRGGSHWIGTCASHGDGGAIVPTRPYVAEAGLSKSD